MRRALIALACVAVLTASCNRQPPQQAGQPPLGQGYDTPQGYQQPDHGFLYYWLWYNVLFSNRQPTYHVYVPPPGYPATYRPWQPPPRTTTYGPTTAPVARPPSPAAASPRTTGGFTGSQSPSASPRTSGGFTASRPASRPPSPSSSPRTSGGFSGSRPSSSPRSSGGFSGHKG